LDESGTRLFTFVVLVCFVERVMAIIGFFLFR